MIHDLSFAPYSDRHGLYGGQAGDKDGIILNDEYWIVKYPKSTRDMKGIDLPSYTTSPLSEYIGSHIYSILGYDVHETILGWRNDKIVVACKDFCKTRGSLMEMRTIKNAANRELSMFSESELPRSSTGDSVELDELLLHFKFNPILKHISGLEERFWETVVIDIFINNNDRNNGNWGLLYDEENGTYTIAPIYDNGNSFYNKLSDEKIMDSNNEPDRQNDYIGIRTAYERNNHILSAKKMLNQEDDGIRNAVIKVVPLINEKMDDISDFIYSIDEEYKGFSVCSSYRKNIYIESMKERYNMLLLPKYVELKHLSEAANNQEYEL